MPPPVIETVHFRLKRDVTRQQFEASIEASSAFVRSQPGFIRRSLSCTADGLWIEHIEWAGMKEALDAADAIGKTEAVKPFVSCIDGGSIAMHHSHTVVAFTHDDPS